MIHAKLMAQDSKEAIHTYRQYGQNMLVNSNYGLIHGVFKAVTNTDSQTQTVAEPIGDGAIVLTDLVLSANKTVGSTVTLRFTDDSQTVNIIIADSGNSSVNMAIPFRGLWDGWSGARLELITDTLNQSATCSVGFYKIKAEYAQGYSAWAAER